MRTPDELRAISSLLDEALDLAEGERAAWLGTLEGDAARLRPALRKLLDSPAAGETGDLLVDGPLFTAPAATQAEAPCFITGDEVGPYRLLREIGRGGMGEVWLAERSDGHLKRALALKLPTLGMRRNVLIRRFARERDILGALTHPHIARLYDAGLSEDGQPFLALEYVDGLPITAFCSARSLSLRAKVELLRQVLDAVQYAHANLVIHRDLKPSNVLVTAEGKAMLLDFGIAKLLEEAQGEAGETELTQLGGRALTLDYAAPEQLNGTTISIAVDVWALGVLLYEVLVGRRPFSGTRREVEHAIVSEEPPRPRDLPTDLVTIVFKALKKAPRERYATVASLADDLDRWLKHEPVSAQADRLSYRMRKFAFRHKAALAVSLAVFATVLAASAVSVWQARIAVAQARRAEAVQAQLVRLFSESDPEQAQGRSFSAKALLDRRAAALSSELEKQPEVLADLEKEIGRAYSALHDDATAIKHLRASVRGYERLGTQGTESAIEARLLLAQGLTLENDLSEAAVHAERTYSLAAEQLGDDHSLTLRAMLSLGRIDVRSGRSLEGAARYQSVIKTLDAAGSPPSLLRLSALRALGRAQYDLEQLENASLTQKLVRDEMDRIGTVKVATRLGVELDEIQLWSDFGRFPEVVDKLPSLLSRLEAHFGPASDTVHVGHDYWALALAALGRYDDAIDVLNRNLLSATKRDTADKEELAFHHFVAAQVLYEAGRFDDALRHSREALVLLGASPHSFAEICKTRALRAVLLQATGNQGGTGEAREAVASYARLPGHESYGSLAELLHWLAVTERASGNDAAGLAAAEQAAAIWRRRGSDAPPIDRARGAAMAAWMRALTNPLDGRATADWHAASRDYAALRTPVHLARSDLDLMEAELLRASGRAPEAEQAQRLGAKRWHESTGRSPPPFVTLH